MGMLRTWVSVANAVEDEGREAERERGRNEQKKWASTLICATCLNFLFMHGQFHEVEKS